MSETVNAWAVTGRPGSRERLAAVARTQPEPGPGEVRVRVEVCGVCRTDLHLADLELPPRAPGRVPGHEVVGTVDRLGPGTERFGLGDRIGIAWLRQTCGRCRACRAGRENLCPDALFTGWDADGGFAEYAVVDERFAYRIPEAIDDETAAPLLCSGIIGYRAWRRAELPPGGRLGIYGFGGSAHLTAQLALAAGAEVHVLTRDQQARELALQLGAASVGGAYDRPPVGLDAALLFAPVGDLVPVALEALEPGGRAVVAGIYLTDLPAMNYDRALFRERTLTSVTANTRADGEEFLRIAANLGIRPTVTRYGFDEVDRAVDDLAHGRYAGAAVVTR